MKKIFLIFILSWLSISVYAQGSTEIIYVHQKLGPVRGLNQQWGFVDETGKMAVPFKYEAAQEFSEGLAAVKLYYLWGFIDETNRAVIPFKYSKVGRFSEGLARVYNGSEWYFIDKTDRVAIPSGYRDAGDFSEGLARVKYKGKWGFINNAGWTIIPFIYDDASDFSEGLARVKIKPNWIFIDKNGKEVIQNISTETVNETNASSSKRQSATNCAKNTAFGLDLGLGGSFETYLNEKLPASWFASAFGIRVTHHFNPYFGIDFFKINWITDVLTSEPDNFWQMRLQFMPGFRVNSPVFFKCMSVYTAFRLGYGMNLNRIASNFEGLCLETELGLNLTRTVFAGFSYNYHKYFVNGIDYKLEEHTFSFRLGFNFGK